MITMKVATIQCFYNFVIWFLSWYAGAFSYVVSQHRKLSGDRILRVDDPDRLRQDKLNHMSSSKFSTSSKPPNK